MHTLKKRLGLAFIAVLLISAAAFVAAQQVVDPNFNITFPPPVYLLRDEMPVRGTVNLDGMSHYYVEFRSLNEDGTPQDEDEPWFPLAYSEDPVIDGELGVWDTHLSQDGLYELRVNVALANGDFAYSVVSPLRVENEIPPFLITPTPFVTPTLGLPTLLPTPTALGPNPRATLIATQPGLENVPTVTALVDANLRNGDSTLYPIVGVLYTGETAQVIGVSTLNSRWMQVRTANGTVGWIAPSVVSTAGDFSSLPFVEPPPLPTATRVPFTATPASAPDLLINGFRFDPVAPACGQSFTIFMNIANIGTAASTISGSVLVQDILVSNNQTITTGSGTFNGVVVGGNFVVVVPMFVNASPNQLHRIVITLDSGNQVFESNETNNSFTQDYTLAQGTCP